MKKIRTDTEKAPQPGGWYSQGFAVGNILYTAGITAYNPETNQLDRPGDIVMQTRQTLKNLQAVLQAGGSDLAHVIKTLVFIADIDKSAIFNETYKEFFLKLLLPAAQCRWGNFLMA